MRTRPIDLNKCPFERRRCLNTACAIISVQWAGRNDTQSSGKFVLLSRFITGQAIFCVGGAL